MKRTLSLLAAIVALAAAHPSAGVQALPTADQVIDKYIEALGGRAAIEKLTSRVTKGSMETPDGAQVGTVTISEKAPNKSLAVIDSPAMGGTFRQGTDGMTAWEDQPGAGVTEKTGAELADALRDGTFNSELKMKTTYKTLVVTKREKVGTRDAYAVVATPAAGTPITLYFDVESGLMVRQTSSRDTAQGRIDVDVFLEDYRTVDGVKQPHVVRQVTAMFSFVIKITEIKHNVALADAMFKRPGL